MCHKKLLTADISGILTFISVIKSIIIRSVCNYVSLRACAHKKAHTHNLNKAKIDVKSVWLHCSQAKNQPHFKFFALDVVSTTQMHSPHLDICDTVALRVKILCHRETRNGVVYASQCSPK